MFAIVLGLLFRLVEDVSKNKQAAAPQPTLESISPSSRGVDCISSFRSPNSNAFSSFLSHSNNSKPFLFLFQYPFIHHQPQSKSPNNPPLNSPTTKASHYYPLIHPPPRQTLTQTKKAHHASHQSQNPHHPPPPRRHPTKGNLPRMLNV